MFNGHQIKLQLICIPSPKVMVGNFIHKHSFRLHYSAPIHFSKDITLQTQSATSTCYLSIFYRPRAKPQATLFIRCLVSNSHKVMNFNLHPKNSARTTPKKAPETCQQEKNVSLSNQTQRLLVRCGSGCLKWYNIYISLAWHLLH